MPSPSETFRRLWQPRRGLFRLIVALQLLSSAIVLFVQITEPPDGLRLALSLWREAAPASTNP